MTRVLIDWGGRGTVVVARTHLEIDGARTPLSGADRVVRVRLDPAGDYLLAGDRVLEANAVSTP